MAFRLLLLAATLLVTIPASAGPVEVGAPGPDFTLPSTGDTTITLSALRGSPVVLNVWASWCGPCVDELPSLDALHDRLEGVGVVLALNVDEQRAPAEALLKRSGADLPVAWDTAHDVVQSWGPRKMPTTYLLDGQGVVVERIEGGLSAAQIADLEVRVRALVPKDAE